MSCHQHGHSQTRNTGGVGASIAGAYSYVHTFMCVYNGLLYSVDIQRMYKREKRLCQDHKINSLFPYCAIYHRRKHLAYTFFQMSCLQLQLFNKGNSWCGWWVCLCMIFCKLLVDATRFVMGALLLGYMFRPHAEVIFRPYKSES
jgi:hypothetical protein